ncbi:MAG: hypothetical protein PVH79_02635 [Candidatus Bathyarchaeota archaeon]
MMPEGNHDEFTEVLYGCRADEITKVVILTPITSVIETLKKKASEIVDLKGFNWGFKGLIDGVEATVLNSRIGSPTASDCAYYLRFTACHNIIYTGLIGSLQPEIRVGDLIVPTAALRGEGASKYFVDEAYPAVADFQLLRKLASTLENAYLETDVEVHYGPIYTTDSFAAETPEFLKLWSSRRLLGIEMETSAIYVIASMYGMRAASVHVVSDNPITKMSFFDDVPEEDMLRRRKCMDILIEALVDFLKKI